jgi:hypothetical protein
MSGEGQSGNKCSLVNVTAAINLKDIMDGKNLLLYDK